MFYNFYSLTLILLGVVFEGVDIFMWFLMIKMCHTKIESTNKWHRRYCWYILQVFALFWMFFRIKIGSVSSTAASYIWKYQFQMTEWNYKVASRLLNKGILNSEYWLMQLKPLCSIMKNNHINCYSPMCVTINYVWFQYSWISTFRVVNLNIDNIEI